MRNIFKSLASAALMAALAVPQTIQAVGWPANHQGVMLQGFYWDSYTDTQWSKLEANCDEYSQYFNLIWVPNSAKAEGARSMGYHPIYWFTNHNSSFGTEAQLLSMISKYKERKVGFIGDFVVNHRSGVSNWTNFPTEEWNGQSWHIGLDGICRNDEVNNPGNPGGATGANDTGENWDGSRDLDHTNANVQNNVKNYAKCLLTKYGYVGLRYDMVKGYSPSYVGTYNSYANVSYSVGEYWDGSYDTLAWWIEGTGKKSAVFDFCLKYILNDAFTSHDYSKLVWKANGTTDQPAGLIHFGYPQYAVTFVDNHDTYGDDWNGFKGNVVAANAFILFSPGTPCIFLKHYQQNKAAIQKLIKLRNACGISNTSQVTVLQTNHDCYMAEIKGSKYNAVVKIGPAQVSPGGYSTSDIKASGTDYCVWTKANVSEAGIGTDVFTGGTTTGGGGGGGGDQTGSAPSQLYIMGNLQQGSWKTNVGVTMTKNGEKFTASNVNLVAEPGETYAFFTFVTALGTTGLDTEWDEVINGSDRYGATSKDELLTSSAPIQLFAEGVDASAANSWAVKPGTYTITADFSTMTVSLGNGSSSGDDNPPTPPTIPSKLYVIGEVEGNAWSPTDVVEMTKTATGFEKVLEVTPGSATATDGYFSFCLNPAATWDDLNAVGNRFAPAVDTELTLNGEAKAFAECADGNKAKAFHAKKGKYKLVIDWTAKTACLKDPNASAVEEFDIEEVGAPVRWFNMQGVEIAAPQAPGVYIRLQGKKSAKIAL